MYSVVLMMALTSGGDVPALGHGCCGGCYGCYGGGHGCHGGRTHGCHGGRGGCHGGHHKHGCCGGGYGCYGCYGGCYGGTGCYGGSYGGIGTPVVPGLSVPNIAPPGQSTTPAPSKKTTNLEGAAPATLIVSVPAEARLSIDGEATTSTATQRVFVSPALNFGREYSYTVKAEFRKDGKMVTLSKEVAVKAGEETRVSFDADNSAAMASR